MKFQVFLIVALMGPAFSWARAGGMDAGGGKGVVCRDQDRNIVSVELLDLWEAREIFGRKLLKSELSLEETVKAQLEKLKYSVNWGGAIIDGVDYASDERFMQKTLKTAQLFLKERRPIRFLSGVDLTLSPDSYEWAKPRKCEIEQIVTYVDSESEPLILINKDLYDKMDLGNKAALIVHEAFYEMLRNWAGEPNSIRVRRAVGYIFAGFSFSKMDTLLGKSYLMCTSADDNEFGFSRASVIHFYKSASGKIKVLPQSLFGLVSIGYFEGSEEIDYGSQISDVVQNKRCGNSGHHPPLYSILKGLGPVDFTNSATLILDCSQHPPTLYISASPTIPAAAQRLYCEEVHLSN